MKKSTITFLVVIMSGLLNSCGDEFLEKVPLGVVSDAVLANKEGLDQLLVGAYAQLDGLGHNQNAWPSTGPSNFVWGSVSSDNSYKGSDPNDQPMMEDIDRYSSLFPQNPYLNQEWAAIYDGVSRCNDVLRVTAIAVDQGTINAVQAEQYTAEARFLRGHYHFEAKQEFGNIPYIDEFVTDFLKAGNVSEDGTFVDAWPDIEADFQFAVEHLPPIKSQPGRCDQWAAKAYLAKCYMWQSELLAAKPFLDDIIANGPYKLVDNYHDNFRIETNNNSESIWEYQSSVNDGANNSTNGNFGDLLNYTFGGPGACCGFHQPSINGVNAHQTDENGLPLLDTFNDTDVVNDQGLLSSDPFIEHSGPLDPRLDWSVGRRGIPYLDWGDHPGKNWVRNQEYGGPYAPKKNVFYQNEQGSLASVGSWAPGVNANNVRLIRLAHVILWRAEVAVFENDLGVAVELVNMIRDRADNYHVQEEGIEDDGTHPNDAANYRVEMYPTFPDQEYAWKAVKFEHRLEFYMEGFRFFNLVRWGDAAEVLNKYLDKEQAHREYYVGASFTPQRNEYFPIPQEQIDVLGPEVLRQNPGY